MIAGWTMTVLIWLAGARAPMVHAIHGLHSHKQCMEVAAAVVELSWADKNVREVDAGCRRR